MADKNIVKQEIAERRRRRVRARVLGTAERPRLTVVKSLKNVFAQLVDEEKRMTILGVGTQSTTLKGSASGKSKVEAAKLVGMKIAEMAKAKGIEKVVFDRNRFRYHGRVKALADGAREGGLKF